LSHFGQKWIAGWEFNGESFMMEALSVASQYHSAVFVESFRIVKERREEKKSSGPQYEGGRRRERGIKANLADDFADKPLGGIERLRV
jgi:hypothetical protein